jgi:hypothetical protein
MSCRGLLPLALLLALQTVACSSDGAATDAPGDSGGEGDEPSPAGGGGAGSGGGPSCGGQAGAGHETIEQSCAKLAVARCQKGHECDPAGTLIQLGDEPTCVARETKLCLAAASLEGSGQQGASIAECVGALACSSCAALAADGYAACRFMGARENGASCSSAVQCKGGVCQNLENGCGVCAAFLPEGSECAEQDGSCAPGSYCLVNHNQTSCGGGFLTGDPCSLDPCMCGSGNECVDGKCTPGLGYGEPCDPSQGKNGGCDGTKALSCSTQTLTCRGIGKCQALADAGQPCDNSQPLLCKSGLTCGSGGVCVLPSQEAAPCEIAGLPTLPGCDNAKGLICNFKTLICEPMKIALPGEPCLFDPANGVFFQCAGRSFCSGKSFAICSAGEPCTCVPSPDEGSACTPEGYPSTGQLGDICYPPSRCLGGTCKVEPLVCPGGARTTKPLLRRYAPGTPPVE